MSDYLKDYAQQFAGGLVSNAEIKRFANNPDVIGAYAECAVRQMIRPEPAPERLPTLIPPGGRADL